MSSYEQNEKYNIHTLGSKYAKNGTRKQKFKPQWLHGQWSK